MGSVNIIIEKWGLTVMVLRKYINDKQNNNYCNVYDFNLTYMLMYALVFLIQIRCIMPQTDRIKSSTFGL